MRGLLLGCTVFCLLWPSAGVSQVQLTRAGFSLFMESYTPEEGLGFGKVTETTLPFTAQFSLGRRGALALSTGYARLSVSDLETGGTTEEISGPLDTEVRVSLDVVPDRMSVFLNGSLPTGNSTFSEDELLMLGTLSADVLGFSATGFGSGGQVGLGLAGALPAGRLAFAYAVTVQQPFAFVPVLGTDQSLRPGGELRLRGGLQGGIGRETFLRFAAILSMRKKDEFAGATVNGVGTRLATYASMDRTVGRATLSGYLIHIRRSDPSIEPTATGAAFVPRGSVTATGGQLSIPLTPRTRLTPRAEFRTASQGLEEADSGVEELGWSIRFGADLRVGLQSGWWLVAQGDRLMGDLASDLADVPVRGYRLSLHLEWLR